MAKRLLEGKLSNGVTYEFETFGARKGIPLKAKVAKILGKPLMNLMGNMGKDDEGDTVIEPEVLKKIMDELLGRLEDDLLGLLESIVSDVKLDGEVRDFDEYYSADYKPMYELAIIVLKGNYGNLLSSVGISHTLSPQEIMKAITPA